MGKNKKKEMGDIDYYFSRKEVEKKPDKSFRCKCGNWLNNKNKSYTTNKYFCCMCGSEYTEKELLTFENLNN